MCNGRLQSGCGSETQLTIPDVPERGRTRLVHKTDISRNTSSLPIIEVWCCRVLGGGVDEINEIKILKKTITPQPLPAQRFLASRLDKGNNYNCILQHLVFFPWIFPIRGASGLNSAVFFLCCFTFFALLRYDHITVTDDLGRVTNSNAAKACRMAAITQK